MAKEYINPPTLFPSQQFGFSQIVTSTPGKFVFLSGQVGWDHQQTLTGDGGFRTQVWQAMENIKMAMTAAGGQLSDVVSMRIYIVGREMDKSHHVSEALRAFFDREQAPTTTWIGVHSLAHPDFLIEIEATAVIS